MHGTIPATDVVANMAEALDVDAGDLPQQQQPADFAPLTNVERAERMAQATGDVIRAAYRAAGKAMLDLAAEAEAIAADCRKHAEEFNARVNEVADEQAKEIESALLSVKGTLAIISAQRLKMVATANGAAQQTGTDEAS